MILIGFSQALNEISLIANIGLAEFSNLDNYRVKVLTVETDIIQS